MAIVEAEKDQKQKVLSQTTGVAFNKDKDTESLAYSSTDETVEDEPENYRLDLKQKWHVFGAIFISFLIFGLLFFPYQSILRYYFISFAQKIPLGFSQLELSLFGTSFIDNLSYQSPENINLTAKQFKLDIPLLEFISDDIEGALQFLDVSFSSQTISLSAKQLNIAVNIEDTNLAVSEWEGKLGIKAKGFKLIKLGIPEIESVGADLSNLEVQKFELRLAFSKNKLDFNGSQLASNYFTVNLKGFARTQAAFKDSRLNGELCFVPAADLEEKEAGLMGIYILAGGVAGGELCLKLRGKLMQPGFEKPTARPDFNPPEDQPQENTTTPEVPKLREKSTDRRPQENTNTPEAPKVVPEARNVKPKPPSPEEEPQVSPAP